MLKELFLIDAGILLFHYTNSSTVTDLNDDQAILSSGLFGAITDFSERARSGVLESMNTENENILFKKIPETDTILVGVFDRGTTQRLSQEFLQKTHGQIFNKILPFSGGLVDLDPPTAQKLRDDISKLELQLFGGVAGTKSYLNTLFATRGDIPLAFLVDNEKKALIASFSRPQSLFKSKLVQSFFLVQSSLQRSLSLLNLKTNWAYFTIQSKNEEYTSAAVRSGLACSIVTGAPNIEKQVILLSALQMCHYPSLTALMGEEPKTLKHQSTITLTKEGLLGIRKGTLSSNIRAPLLTLINTINKLFSEMTRRMFYKVQIILNDPVVELSIQQESEEDVTIAITAEKK